MIPLFISIAVLEFNTLLSMATPNSVNAYGLRLTPILIELEVTNCDLQFCVSSLVS